MQKFSRTRNSVIGITGTIRGLVNKSSEIFLDLFTGPITAVLNRTPTIGPNWNVNGAASNGYFAGNGSMYNTSNAGAAYAFVNLNKKPKEIGCKVIYDNPAIILNISGTAAKNDYIVMNITPSRANNYTQIVAGAWSNSLNSNQMAIVARDMINGTPELINNGITSSANGPIVTITGTECPYIEAAGTGGVTTNITYSPFLTIASWPTGQSSLSGMTHLQTLPSGLLGWSYYINGIVDFSTKNNKTIGFSANTIYTIKCCIDPPNIWGGVWSPNGQLQSSFIGNDDNLNTYSGNSIFFETIAAGGLSIKSVWAKETPSITKAQLEALRG